MLAVCKILQREQFMIEVQNRNYRLFDWGQTPLANFWYVKLIQIL